MITANPTIAPGRAPAAPANPEREASERPSKSRRRTLPAAWATIPGDESQIQAVAAECRRRVQRHALVAAGVAAVPIPGIDWVTDVGILLKLLPQINEAFGLTAEQIERLAPDRRVVVYKVLSASGGLLVGKVITRELVIRALKLVGVRLTTQQAAKFVPLAGQAVSAALTFTAMRFVCEQHIRQCIAVARELQPPPASGLVERLDTAPRDAG